MKLPTLCHPCQAFLVVPVRRVWPLENAVSLLDICFEEMH
jgi:hypothetical protein